LKFGEIKLKGAFVIEIQKLTDERGFFGRSWCMNELKEYGILFNETEEDWTNE